MYEIGGWDAAPLSVAREHAYSDRVEVRMVLAVHNQELARQTLFSDGDIERRARFVDLQPDDLGRIELARPVVEKNAEVYVAAFFAYLSTFEEATALFEKAELLKEAERLKREHLVAMAQGQYGKSYVDERLRLAMLYGNAGLGLSVFLGAYHHLMALIGMDIMAEFLTDPKKAFHVFFSLQKIAFFDLSIIVDALATERERIIGLQQEAIRELSTPVLQLRPGLLLLPIIGDIDARRARQLTDDLLHVVRSKRASVVVMDVTGVAIVDTRVANHLVQAVAAARLMGVTAIVSGLSPNVAQALVTLGLELTGIEAVGDLQGGIEKAERLLGYNVSRGR